MRFGSHIYAHTLLLIGDDANSVIICPREKKKGRRFEYCFGKGLIPTKVEIVSDKHLYMP